MSGDGITGVRPNVFGVEGKNNVRFRYASLFEFIRDTVFGSVALYPYLVVDEIQMDQAVMDTPNTSLPPNC